MKRRCVIALTMLLMCGMVFGNDVSDLGRADWQKFAEADKIMFTVGFLAGTYAMYMIVSADLNDLKAFSGRMTWDWNVKVTIDAVDRIYAKHREYWDWPIGAVMYHCGGIQASLKRAGRW